MKGKPEEEILVAKCEKVCMQMDHGTMCQSSEFVQYWKSQQKWHQGELIRGNDAFDALLACSQDHSIFKYLMPTDCICLQSCCVEIRLWAEIRGNITVPMVEADAERALYYLLWGPYHN